MPPFTKPGSSTPEEPKVEATTLNAPPAVTPEGLPLNTEAIDITPTTVASQGEMSKAQQKRINEAVAETSQDPWKIIMEMKKTIEDLNRKVDAVSDKGRLNQFEERNKEGLGKICSISTYKGKVVQSWSDLVTNTVQLHHNNMHTYDQTTILSYLDGSTEKVDYQIWQRDKVMIKAIVENEVTEKKTGLTTFSVSTEKYGKFDIDSRFIN